MTAEHTPGPWEYIPSDEHHGAYVVGPVGGDICDCYTMSDPNSLSVRNGGSSRPVAFQGESMDANARLIAAAPDLLSIAKRWTALDAGAWHPDRHAAEKAELLTLTRATIAKAEERV